MRPITSIALGSGRLGSGVAAIAACAVALAAGTTLPTSSASAQIVSRQITSAPVETTVTQGANGTVVTQRILGADPGLVAPYPAPPLPYPPDVAAAAAETEVVPPPVVPSTTRVTTRRAVVSRPVRTRTVRRVTRERPSTVGLAVASAPAPALTVPQRRVIYRTIVQQAVYPAAPAVLPPVAVVPPPVAAYPLGAVYPTDDVYAGAPYADANTPYYQPTYRRPYYWDGVALVVGARLPASIQLAPVPAAVAASYPDVAPYSYAYVDDRVYLVDPTTDIIMAELTR